MHLQFHEKISLSEISNRQFLIEAPWINLKFKIPSPIYHDVLNHFRQGTTEIFLEDLILEKNQEIGLSYFYYFLHFLEKHALLSYADAHQDPLLTLVPIASTFTFKKDYVKHDQPYVLSRFCFCRNQNGEMVWETPLHASQIKASKMGRELIAHLVQPCTSSSLSHQLSLPQEVVDKCISLLLGAKMISEWNEGQSLEDKDTVFAQWEFHDLLFHTRSRKGRHNNPYGGVYPFKDKIAPLPAVKNFSSIETIPLYRPDNNRLTKETGFWEVLEKRESKRSYGQKPITAEQLGEFLFHSARIKAMRKGNAPYDTSHRPYPAGGACYELELYPIIHACDGIEPGMYHYDPEQHLLKKCDINQEKIELFLQNAKYSTGMEGVPPVLIEISARFQRLSWKYRSMAYATSLKGVGTLTQTMYLVATAMHLAPCAVGGGDSDLFAKALGCNYYEETSIGEFILGSLD